MRKIRGWLLAILYMGTVIFAPLSVALLSESRENPDIRYLSYAIDVLAFLFLVCTVYTLTRYGKQMKAAVVRKLRQRKMFRILWDEHRRVMIFATVSLSISIAYCLYNALIGLRDRSVWFTSLAGYYLLLILLRGGVLLRLRDKSGDAKREIRTYRNCGVLLIALIFALSIAILQTVRDTAVFGDRGLYIYLAASYAFYKITRAIIHFVRAKKQDSLIMQALRNINLSDAAVSIFALQTSLIKAFGDGSQARVPNAITGAAVCTLVLVVGVVMIIRANRKLKQTVQIPHGESV